MAELFNAFLSGMERADYDKQARARKEAGKAYAAGDLDWAQNELLGQGLTQEAGQLGTLAEQRRAIAARKAAQEAMQGNTDPREALKAGADVYLQQGDVDHFAQFQDVVNGMDANQRAQAQQIVQAKGQIFGGILQAKIPEADRPAYALQQAIQMGYREEDVKPIIDQISQTPGGWSDDGLHAQIYATQTAAEMLAGERYDKQQALEAQRWGAEYAQRERLANAGRVSFDQGDVRQWGNQYDNEQQQAQQELGILGPSLGYAYTALANSGDTTKIPGINYRQADVALLRAAARAQTGPGVLQQSEVWGTLSPSLRQSLMSNLGYADYKAGTISPEDRASLAGFVARQAEQSTRRAWNLYNDYDARLNSFGKSASALGLRPPLLPHPDDVKFLTDPTAKFQAGKEYTAPSGRTYLDQGGGNWVFVKFGQPQTDAPALPAITPGGIDRPRGAIRGADANQPTQAHINALLAHKDDPAARAAFDRQYGAGAANKVLGPQAPQTQPGGYNGR